MSGQVLTRSPGVAQTKPVIEPLTEIRNSTFQNELVVLDDKAFFHCSFEECELRYHGGPVTFQETAIIGCSWSFGGAAHRTINLLQLFGLHAARPEASELTPAS
jgi:hypothetical protein